MLIRFPCFKKMAILPLLIYPDPILSKKAKRITDPKSPEIRELLFDMLETLEKNNGLGLAAPQVGKSLQMSVIKFDGKTLVLINPKIKSKSWKKTICEEGCLSFPGLFIPVKRYAKVKVEAEDQTGKKRIISGAALLGRALQHEIDHLNGIVFTKRKSRKKSVPTK